MKVLVAGATGYLGSHIVWELMYRELDVLALARSPQKLIAQGLPPERIVTAEVTDSQTLVGICEGVDVVISALGITRQRDGLSYMDVDYQANKNLLDEAVKSGVQQFVYVSVLKGDELRHLQICAAKERFVEELRRAGLGYTIIRPGGFFSDLAELYKMAASGRVYLFGDGQTMSNPIHGADLAVVCADAINSGEEEIEVGGPEVLSQNDLAKIAFLTAGKPPKVTHIPDWVRRILLRLARVFMSKGSFGPVEFFLHVLAMEMVAPAYGETTIVDFYKTLADQDS